MRRPPCLHRLALMAGLLLLTAACTGPAAPARGALTAEPALPDVLAMYAFRKTEHRPAVVFARTADPFQHHPLLFVHSEGAWRRIDLDSEDFQQHTWVHAAAARGGPALWGIADIDVESSGWELQVVRSLDAGRTFTHATLRKPHYLAQFHTLRMGADGAGAITVYLNDDYGDSAEPGYYTSLTKDAGATWSDWQYGPDMLVGPDLIPPSDAEPLPPLEPILEDLARQGS